MKDSGTQEEQLILDYANQHPANHNALYWSHDIDVNAVRLVAHGS